MLFGKYVLDIVCDACGFTQRFVAHDAFNAHDAALLNGWCDATDREGGHICRRCQDEARNGL
jgi:hypothetical protein